MFAQQHNEVGRAIGYDVVRLDVGEERLILAVTVVANNSVGVADLGERQQEIFTAQGHKEVVIRISMG